MSCTASWRALCRGEPSLGPCLLNPQRDLGVVGIQSRPKGELLQQEGPFLVSDSKTFLLVSSFS